MQAHQETIKKYGHIRRPSYGKAMPISSLLLDLTAPQQRHFESISNDGLSPRNDGQPVVFTFGPGGPRYTNNAEQLGQFTANFLNNEKITGIAQKIESEEPKQALFLKCTNYQPKQDSVEQTDDESKSDIESVTSESSSDDESILSDDDKQTKEPSFLRSISQRQEFLAGMLGDETALADSVQLETSFNKAQKEAKETAPERQEIEFHQPLIEEIEGHDVDNDLCKSDRAKEDNEAQPFVTEPDTDDEVDVGGHLQQRGGPIDMGSNDTEPSDTDPFELEPIITYPEEILRIIEEGEDLIRFDEDDDAVPDSQLTIENLAKFDREYFRNKLAIAEALAQATMLTPSAASRRLAARKMEMNINDPDFVYDSVNGEFIPPKDLLLYLVR